MSYLCKVHNLSFLFLFLKGSIFLAVPLQNLLKSKSGMFVCLTLQVLTFVKKEQSRNFSTVLTKAAKCFNVDLSCWISRVTKNWFLCSLRTSTLSSNGHFKKLFVCNYQSLFPLLDQIQLYMMLKSLEKNIYNINEFQVNCTIVRFRYLLHANIQKAKI